MKVVIDTNVFVSGVFFSGPPYLILRACMDKSLQMVVSAEILAEYQRVGEILGEEYPGIALEPVLAFVIQHALVIMSAPLPEGISSDPDDDKFIACALAGESSVIISGDKHLLAVSGYEDIEVLKPGAFLAKYLEGADG